MRWWTFILVAGFFVGCHDSDNEVGKFNKAPKGEPILQVANKKQVTKAIDLVSGMAHVCAHLEDHRITCWGDNKYGALNIHSARNAQKKYYDVTHAEFSKITAGLTHTCGILRSPPYEGIPVCFGEDGEYFDVPHEPVKEISSGVGFNCVIKQDDTLACVSSPSRIRVFNKAGGYFVIKASEFLQWGIDPHSGAERQDYTTKRFKDVKAGEANVCARGFEDDLIYCMGNNLRDTGNFGTAHFIDYDTGTIGDGVGILDNGRILYLGNHQAFRPLPPRISDPLALKYKKVFNRHGYLTAAGNSYDDGTPIPENTLITTTGSVKEAVTKMVSLETSYKIKRVSVEYYLTTQGKVGYLKDCPECVSQQEISPVVQNLPREIAE